jgi:hypothetical protein
MYALNLNASEFEARAQSMGAALDQMPYALSRALNSAARTARRSLISDTWPSHVTVRNTRFLNAVLLTRFSDKHNLRVEVYDSTPDQRAHLELHAKGGMKTPKGARLAVPIAGNILGVQPTASGVPKNLRAKALVASTPKRALRIATIKRSGNQGIFIGRGGRLNLIYALTRQAQIKKTVPFYEDWNDLIRRDTRLNFPSAMRQAMATRK